MADPWSRRRVLRGLGASAVAGLAGCSGAEPQVARLSVTPAPVPSDTPSPTPTATPGARPDAEAVRFRVELLSGFDADGPARLSIAVRNDGPLNLTAVGVTPHVFPFVDDQYAGTDRAGRPRLFLLPENAALVTDRPNETSKPVSTLLPERATEGCWSTRFEGRPPVAPSNRFLFSVTLAPGETISHDYRVYFIGACGAGRYSFQAETLLAAGDPPGRNGIHRLLTGFYLSVSSDLRLSIGLEDPVITSFSRSADE